MTFIWLDAITALEIVTIIHIVTNTRVATASIRHALYSSCHTVPYLQASSSTKCVPTTKVKNPERPSHLWGPAYAMLPLARTLSIKQGK